MSPKPIRILLVDDHPVVRAGLRTVSDVDHSIVIVGEASDAKEALVAIRHLRPDAVLLDIRLPDRSGLALCKDLKGWDHPPKVLLLTSFADNKLVLAAMEAEADGYLLKNNQPSQIARALHSVMNGETIFDAIPAKKSSSPAFFNDGPAHLKSLSSQERKVLEAVAEGKTDKEVAAILGLHPKTVRNYLDRVFQKLEVNTRTQAALFYDRFIRDHI